MNSLSHLYVTAQQNEKLAAVANERLARMARPARAEHTPDAARKHVWSLRSGPAERPASLPTLTNYPYRG